MNCKVSYSLCFFVFSFFFFVWLIKLVKLYLNINDWWVLPLCTWTCSISFIVFIKIHNFYSPLSLCSLNTPCIQYFYLFCLHSQNISCLMPNFWHWPISHCYFWNQSLGTTKALISSSFWFSVCHVVFLPLINFAICFLYWSTNLQCFQSDWLRGWCKFSRPIT